MSDNSIDLTVTSPPYDNLRNYNNNSDFNFDKFKEIAVELYRVTKKGGVFVWVVGDQTIKGSETGTSFKQALYFKEIGFNLHDTMIWEKSGMIPTQDRYYNVFEYMFILSKGKPKTMNFLKDRKNKAPGKKYRKNKVINKGQPSYKDGDEFTLGEYGRRTNIWCIYTGKNKFSSNHPAPFPFALARDHILTWSEENDIVFDPFLGSGTTAFACIEVNRSFIGTEIEQNYFSDTKQRIEDYLSEAENASDFLFITENNDERNKTNPK